MVESDVQKDIERLENRMRTNFFEIERRLTELEEKIQKIESTTFPEDIDERIKELEDLILLIQAENLQIKQKLFGEVGLPETDLEKRVKKIEEFLEPEKFVKIVREVVKEEGLEVKDLKGINERLSWIEDQLKRYQKALDEFRAPEMEKIKEELEGRISKLEKMKEIVDQIASDREVLEKKFEEVMERFSRIEQKFSENGFYFKIIKDLQARVDDLKERIRNVERISREIGSEKVTDKIKEMKEIINNLRDSLVKVNSALKELKIEEESLKKVITKIPVLEDEFYEIKRHIDEKVEKAIEKHVGNLNQLRNEIESKVREFNVLEETLKRSLSEYDREYNVLKKRLDRGLLKIEGFEKIFEELGSFELRLKALESIVHKFDDVEKTIKKLNEDLRLKTKRLEEEIEKVKIDSQKVETLEKVYGELKDHFEGLESIVNDERSRVEGIDKNLMKLAKDYEDLKRSIFDLKGRVNEFEFHLPKISELEEKMYLLNKIASLEENIDKANIALIKLQTEKEKLERLAASLERMRSEMELESKEKLEKMRKYEQELRELEERIKGKVEEILLKYVGDLKKILSEIEEERVQTKGMLEAKMSQLELLEKDIKDKISSIGGVKQELDKYKQQIIDELFSKLKMRIEKYFEGTKEEIEDKVKEAVERKLDLEVSRRLEILSKRLERVEKFVPTTGRYRPIKILLKEKKPEYWYEQ